MKNNISRLDFACHSITGNIRSHNEDNISFFGKCLYEEHGDMEEPFFESVTPEKSVMVAVFDGMGGEQAGEKASFIAAMNLLCFREVSKWEEDTPDELVRLLNAAVCKEKKNGGYKQIGTTMSLIAYRDGFVQGINVGDSPIYLFRDDSLVMLSVSHREQRERLPSGKRKTILTQFLGIEEDEFILEPHTCVLELKPGDLVMLCSDGLSDMLDAAEITEILSQHLNVKEMVKGLTEAANEKGGNDNITVCIMNVL